MFYNHSPKMKIISDFERILFRSPNPKNVYCYSPGLAKLGSGRLVATFDLGGPGVKDLPGNKSSRGDFGCCNQGKVYVSDDKR